MEISQKIVGFFKGTFPVRPNMVYIASFVAVMTAIPSVTISVYYFVVLDKWWLQPELENEPEENIQNFQKIKEVLVRYGYISQEQSEDFSNTDINTSYAELARSLASKDLDLDFLELFSRVGIPVVAVIILFFIFALRVEIPGVTKAFPYQGKLPNKTMDYASDLTRAIITVDGFIISLLGASLVSSGLNNIYFFLGFETIIISLILSLASYPSFIRAGTLKEEDSKMKEENALFKAKLEIYFRLIGFASWSLILGLIFLAASFA